MGEKKEKEKKKNTTAIAHIRQYYVVY